MIIIRICLITILALLTGTQEIFSGSRQPEITHPDTSVIPDSLPIQSRPPAAASPRNSDTSRVNLVPEGFVLLKSEKTSTLSSLCDKDSLCQLIFMKVNRTDRSSVPAGKTVLLPVDIDKALSIKPCNTGPSLTSSAMQGASAKYAFSSTASISAPMKAENCFSGVRCLRGGNPIRHRKEDSQSTSNSGINVPSDTITPPCLIPSISTTASSYTSSHSPATRPRMDA